MTEPDQVEFRERVSPVQAGRRRDPRGIPVRIGIVVGSAALVVIGVVAAMGASPAAPSSAQANLSGAVAPATGTDGASPLDNGFGGFKDGMLGRLGFRAITISAINGSSLSLKTEDGWTRTIAITGSTTITKGGATIAAGDLAVGDEIRFAQEKASDGSYSITAIHVVLPAIGGEVTAVTGDTITVKGKDGTTGTIHVSGATTYEVGGTTGKALADITVGSVVIAEGTLRTDGSLDATAVHSGFRGFRDGDRPGRMFPGKPAEPNATPTPTSNAS